MASSSLVAAAGESQENKNVSLFDTLLPPGKSSVIKGNTYILLLLALCALARVRYLAMAEGLLAVTDNNRHFKVSGPVCTLQSLGVHHVGVDEPHVNFNGIWHVRLQYYSVPIL